MEDFWYEIENGRSLPSLYNPEVCIAALRGVKVPEPEDLDYSTHKLCVIRGIRYHPGFATLLHGTNIEFTHALNARRIMSNDIPEMEDDELPYCIWYPEIASEATYRELARRYPSMKYLVGRSCAVAGYVKLFQELNLLPEVHIAEEAWDNGHWAILQSIISSDIDVTYSAMDDYTRELRAPRLACLNGDTAVRSWLEIKHKHEKEPFDGFESLAGYKGRYFNITGDMSIDERNSQPSKPEDVSKWLYSPLPKHLPNINKDLLIVMAAYNGDIDRYARLRRPITVRSEHNCILRGIYHNTMFAKWWSLQPSARTNYRILSAINARFIMSNDLSRINDETKNLPYCIWYPDLASEHTYRELARRQPRMKAAVARACIIAGFKSLFTQLDIKPDPGLMAEAQSVADPFYRHDLERKLEGVDMSRSTYFGWGGTNSDLAMKKAELTKTVSLQSVRTSFEGIYEQLQCGTGDIDLNVCISDAVKEGLRDRQAIELGDLYSVSRSDGPYESIEQVATCS